MVWDASVLVRKGGEQGILGEVVFLRGLEVLMSREWDFLQSSIRVDVPRQFGGAWFSPRQVESRVGPEVSLLESSSFRKIKGEKASAAEIHSVVWDLSPFEHKNNEIWMCMYRNIMCM